MWNKIKRKLKKKKALRYAAYVSGVAVFIVLIIVVLKETHIIKFDMLDNVISEDPKSDDKADTRKVPKIDLDVRLLTPNKYSRPQIALDQVNAVVVHYTANPGTDAVENRNYFNNLPNINKNREEKSYVSSHFVIGLDGDIVQCVPLSEMAYASNDRNSDTVSIECCHRKKSGIFEDETYDALMELLAYLCIRYDLDPDKDIIRHYDITGKLCPKYYVDNPESWEQLKRDARDKRDKTVAAIKAGKKEYELFDNTGTKIKEGE